jgi:hypothetical protein
MYSVEDTGVNQETELLVFKKSTFWSRRLKYCITPRAPFSSSQKCP